MVWSTCKQTTSCMFVIFDITLSKHIFNQNSYFIFSNFSIPRIPKSFRYLWTPRLFYEVWKIERICNTIGIIIQDSKWTKDELCCDLWTCLISRTTPQKYYFTHLCEISTFCYLGFFLKWTKNKGDEYTWNRKWQWASNHFYDYFAALPHLITKVTKEDNGYHFKKILLWQRASQWMIFVFKSLPFSLMCAWKKIGIDL